MNQSAPLYLASASPRRRELLRLLGVPFELAEAPVDEKALEAAFARPAAHLAEHLAWSKAAAALERLHELVEEPVRVLAGDTTVLLDEAVLGKPRDVEDAMTMLQSLRGRTHHVVSALAMAEGGDRAEPTAIRSLAVRTSVSMRNYADAEITTYIATRDPFDKAGAYAIQHDGFHPVLEISGCYPNVVGLPVCAAAALLGVRSAARSDHQEACPWSKHCRLPYPNFT